MAGSLIISAARTPIGKLSGAFSQVPATQLGGHAIRATLERAGLDPIEVEHVFMGQVIQAGAGQVPARQAAVLGGIPLSVPANTLNKACLSGINAIHLADQMIAAGDADIVVAGGMESMTGAPYLLPDPRAGFRLGDQTVLDSMLADGLRCAFDHIHMGESADRDLAARPEVTRDRQDEFAAQSHDRACAAQKAGRFEAEIAPFTIENSRGDVLVEDDEGPRPGTTVEKLARLRPAFVEGGTITAGNASQISDGGVALVIASRRAAERLGLTPRAEIVGYGMVAGPDLSLLSQPARAITRALERSGLALNDVDLFEINEAFAGVALASIDELSLTDDVVNVNGGAVALGHPIAMSGARIVASIVEELQRRGGGIGVAGLCGAGGQGDAIVVRSL